MKSITLLTLLAAVMFQANAAPTSRADTPTATESGQSLPQDELSLDQKSYIVVFKDDAFNSSLVHPGQTPAELARQLVDDNSGQLGYTYDRVLLGFSASLTSLAMQNIRAHPSVDYITEDDELTTVETQTPTPSWGIDRIDQPTLPLDNSYTYYYDGTGVNVFVVDTGILDLFSDFDDRVNRGTDMIETFTDRGDVDCSGHGTHVAGIIGEVNYGVAKNVTLHPVRVFPCLLPITFDSIVIAGIEWVTEQVEENNLLPAVVNLSLGRTVPETNIIDPLEEAIRNSIDSGITYVIAANNHNDDACNYSPGRMAEAITVGASTRTDERMAASSFGPCVDLFAPGEDILSAWHINPNGNILSGTSMAAPHVTGAVAQYLEREPSATPADVKDEILNRAVFNQLTGNLGNGSPNLLLQTLHRPVPVCDIVTISSPGVTTATFGTTGSHDPDGSIASYAWTFFGGTSPPGSGPSSGTWPPTTPPIRTFVNPISQTITGEDVVLTLTDNDGLTSSKTCGILVEPLCEDGSTLPPNGLACVFLP